MLYAMCWGVLVSCCLQCVVEHWYHVCMYVCMYVCMCLGDYCISYLKCTCMYVCVWVITVFLI